MADLNRNQLAALWLCYVTNDFYKAKLNRPLADVLADANFIVATGLTPEHIQAVHERIFQNPVAAKLDKAREAFQDVFRPAGGTALWDSGSPATDIIAAIATRVGR